ncbi:hypothetical protein OOT46_05575 [Aquabacterium sp. A7-Y]|uniref:O-linked N-acetylglucosamine transferase, SPINDLY family protein n=1 Tax=Aquabacterium sp. A7-Y TaxID=1349605 RepID=UPI00223E226D|nr:hypothetical protein [Aquabacterium sp. A7-Y]MCW7537321.1 hypothetical protein [Aquabacterium sp. A7-Y]
MSRPDAAAEALSRARRALAGADFLGACEQFERVLDHVPAGRVTASIWFGYGCALAAIGELRSSTNAVRSIAAGERRALLLHPQLDRALSEVLRIGWDAHQVQALLCAFAMRQGRWEYRQPFTAALQTIAGQRAGVPLHRSLVFDAFSFGRDDALIAALSQRFADDYAGGTSSAAPRPVAPAEARRRPLRVALLSGEWRRHPTCYLHRDLVAALDHRELHLTGIHLDARVDAYTEDMRGLCDDWQHWPGLGVGEIAERLRAGGHDILWVLGSFQETPIAELLPLRPVPLAINGLASYYPHGRGLVDYAAVDPLTVPPAARPHWGEALAELPATTFVLGPLVERHPPRPGRAELGLPEDALVLAATHQSYKWSPECADLWAAVLHRCPNAVLWRVQARPHPEAAWQRAMAERGIGPERQRVCLTVDWPQHMARLGVADLFLDATPMGGHTTLLEALAQGLPAVSLRGPGPAGRIGHAILDAMGLAEACVETPRQYVEQVARWAADPALRARWRQTVADHQPGGPRHSPARDAARQARWWEEVFRRMWEIHCRGLPPTSFRIEQ